MIFFWALYFFLSFSISYLMTMLVKKRILKILIFSFISAILCSIWFRSPGENYIAPVVYIFFLENTIVDSNGSLRILRPLVIFFFLFIFISILLWKNKSKN